MFVAGDIFVTAFNLQGKLWSSRLVSLDGIIDLRFADGVVYGVGVGPETYPQLPFTIDAESGEAQGGYTWSH
jgi:hypothetical protein